MIRPNKNVERKLIAEALSGLQSHFDLTTYRYIGLGSMWFVDFVLFHKILRIGDMVSIEREHADRAQFNQPFACIEVKSGDTSVVLPELDLEAKPLVVWLDYDGPANKEVIEDIRVLAQKAPSGSIVLFSLNASHSQFDGGAGPMSSKEKEELRRARMFEVFGDAVPSPFPEKAFTRSGFAPILAGMMFSAIDRALLKSGRKDGAKLERLFNIIYSDNAPMLTVGGMIANPTDRARLVATNVVGTFSIIGSSQQTINVPPLTMKEKMAIDKLLPCAPLLEEVVRDAYGFRLNQAHLDSYARYYRHYPVFSELLVG